MLNLYISRIKKTSFIIFEGLHRNFITELKLLNLITL